MERDSLRHPVQLIFTPILTHQSLKRGYTAHAANRVVLV